MNYEQSENVVPFITLLGLILIRFIPSFNIISSNFSALKFLTPSKEILVNEFRNKTKINKNYNVKIKKGIKNFNFKSNILFKDVNFKYPNSKELNLKKININIKKNSFVAFIGESGAGKSTIVDLILGLLKPSSGKILIDGNNIQSILSEWYADIGFIPQDIYLDDDTVKNNITFYEENINLNNLKKAIKLSQLEKFIDKLYNSGIQDLKIIENFVLTESSDFEVEETENTIGILNRYIDESEFEGDKTLIKGILQKIYSEACEVD